MDGGSSKSVFTDAKLLAFVSAAQFISAYAVRPHLDNIPSLILGIWGAFNVAAALTTLSEAYMRKVDEKIYK